MTLRRYHITKNSIQRASGLDCLQHHESNSDVVAEIRDVGWSHCYEHFLCDIIDIFLFIIQYSCDFFMLYLFGNLHIALIVIWQKLFCDENNLQGFPTFSYRRKRHDVHRMSEKLSFSCCARKMIKVKIVHFNFLNWFVSFATLNLRPYEIKCK